ncbi:MAG: right-handed parallel beta-helix repeat-containing protein, partial [Acidimicrobiales bacterium]
MTPLFEDRRWTRRGEVWRRGQHRRSRVHHLLMSFVLLAGLLGGTLVAAGSASASTTTLYVGPGGGSGNCASPGYSAIQSAVNAASSGDTVQVCAGAYPEQVTINKSLTLLGDPGGTTVGPGPNAPALDGTGAAGKGIAIEANDVTVSGIVIQNYNTLGTVEPDGIALCDVNNVTISHDRIDNNNYGITIDQQLGSNCSNTTTGTSSNVQVLDNVITHSLWPASCSPNSGCDFEGGIAVTSWYSVGTNLTISGNQIENQNRNGILTGPGSGVQITDNTVSNSGWEAIEADDTASAVIQGNAVSGGYPNSTTNPLYPIGILAYATHGSATTTMSNPQIAGNSVSGASPGGGIPAIVRGVVLQADSGYSLTGVSITGNSLHAFSTAGIYLGPGTVTNTTAHFNDLSGDAIGVDNTVPADPVNATDNWWGSANGPATSANTYNRGSQGIAVTSGVT